MKFKSPLAIALAATVLVAGCLQPTAKPVEIVKPQNGNSTTATEFQIEIRTAVNAGSVQITINGKSIPASAYTITANANGATITGKLPTADLNPGAYNTLKITAQDSNGQTVGDDASFIYGQAPNPGPGPGPGPGQPSDTTPPTLSIAGPLSGQFAGVGARLDVTGTASDNVRVATLHVQLDRQSPTNETQYLNPTDGKYKVEVVFQTPGLHRIRLEAADAAGNKTAQVVSVYVGTAAKSGTKVVKGAEVAISDGGINKVGNLIETFINPPALDVDALIKQFNPIWSGSAGPASASLHVTTARFSRADLDLHTVAGGVDTKARIDNFFLAVRADVKVFFRFSLSGSVKADRIDYRGTALVSKNSGNKASVSIPNATLGLTGFLFDINKFPDALERLASPFVGRFIEGQTGGIVKNTVAPKLEETFNNMSVLSKQIDVMGKTFVVGGDLDSLSFKTAGGEIVVNPLVTALKQDNPNALPLAGYLSTPNSATPTLGFANDLSVAVSDDAINQVLFEAYRAGATNIHFEQSINLGGQIQSLTVALLDTFLGSNFSSDANLQTGLPVSIEVTPMLAPVVLVGGSGLATFQAHDTYIDVYVGPASTRKKLFTFKVNVELPIDSLTLDTTKGTVVPKIDANKAWIEFEVVDQPIVQLLFSAFQSFVPALTKAALPILVDIISKRPLVDFSKLPVGVTSVTLRAAGDYLVTGVNLR